MNGFTHSQCGDNLRSPIWPWEKPTEDPHLSFDRCRLLTVEPFGIGVMNVELWTKNILHAHLFHEGEVVVLTCEETHKQTDYSSSLT